MYSTTEQLTNSINELQSDILGEKLTNNPLMISSKVVAKNKALDTKQKTIVNAINELLKELSTLKESTANDLGRMYQVLGNFSGNPELVNELTNRGASTVLELASQAYDKVKTVENLAKDDFEDVFHVAEGETQTVFHLTHKPVGKIRIYIDGIRYFQDSIAYNAEENTATWTNDSSKPEGFDITDADVVFEYDYDATGED